MQTIIRKFPDGDLILLFPEEIADPFGNILSYQFIGQHGAASPDLINDLSRPSLDKEVLELVEHYKEHFDCDLDILD